MNSDNSKTFIAEPEKPKNLFFILSAIGNVVLFGAAVMLSIAHNRSRLEYKDLDTAFEERLNEADANEAISKDRLDRIHFLEKQIAESLKTETSISPAKQQKASPKTAEQLAKTKELEMWRIHDEAARHDAHKIKYANELVALSKLKMQTDSQGLLTGQYIVSSIIDDQHMIVRDEKSIEYLIEYYPTKDLVENSKLRFQKIKFSYEGTRKVDYRTVYVLEAHDEDDEFYEEENNRLGKEKQLSAKLK